MKASQSQFHDIRGLRYHVRIWGESRHPKIFLLHGWMDVSASFQFLVDALTREWCAIAPDWRGFGLTQWARDGYWFPDYYADLDALLDLYQPDAPVYLVGHSMGGNIACAYAGIKPQRLASVVTLEGLGMPRTAPGDAPRRLVKWLEELRNPPTFRPYRSFADVAKRLKRNNPRLGDAQAEFLAKHWARQLQTGEIVLLGDPRHKLVNPYLYRFDEALACWKRVTAPVLLVTGRQSHIGGWMKDTPAEIAERKSAFANFRETVVENCGHMMHHDQPQRVAEIIESFLISPIDSPA